MPSLVRAMAHTFHKQPCTKEIYIDGWMYGLMGRNLFLWFCLFLENNLYTILIVSGPPGRRAKVCFVTKN